MRRLHTARSVSNFETSGIWDDTVPWGKLVGKYLVDDKGQVRAVRRVNYRRGTVVFKDGEEVPGWKIDQMWRSLHRDRDEAVMASEEMRFGSRSR